MRSEPRNFRHIQASSPDIDDGRNHHERRQEFGREKDFRDLKMECRISRARQDVRGCAKSPKPSVRAVLRKVLQDSRVPRA